MSLSLLPGEVMEKILRGSVAKLLKDKKVMRSRQHGFTKRESCLTDLPVFCVGVASFVDKERDVAGVHFSFVEEPLTLSPLARSQAVGAAVFSILVYDPGSGMERPHSKLAGGNPPFQKGQEEDPG